MQQLLLDVQRTGLNHIARACAGSKGAAHATILRQRRPLSRQNRQVATKPEMLKMRNLQLGTIGANLNLSYQSEEMVRQM